MATKYTKAFVKQFSELTDNLENLDNAKIEFLQRYSAPTKRSGTLTSNDVILYQHIGAGSFANVYLGIDKRTRSDFYAIKVLKKSKIIKKQQVSNVKSERHILASVNFDFIVRLHEHFQDKFYLYLVLEYVEGGELFAFLRQRTYFNETVVKFYIMQIVLALEYLHYMNIIYRDIKPENILITSNGYLKLTDFGFAKLMLSNRTYTICGTPEYLAPEVVLNKGYGIAVDWWALGVLIYEMLAGHTPFSDSKQKFILENIIQCHYKFPSHFKPDVKSLLKKLLTSDLSRRIGTLRKKIDDVKNHKWFAANNSCTWSRIYNQTQDLPREIRSRKNPKRKNFTEEDIIELKWYPSEYEVPGDIFDDF